MKNHLIISLLILSVGFCQQKKTDEPNPKKGIKTETKFEYDYEEKFGEFKEILIIKTISKYDSKGNRVEELFYDSDEKLDRKSIWKYNDKNRLVVKIEYKYELKFGELQETPTSKTIYEYVEY